VPSARGELLARLGRDDEAAAAFGAALTLVSAPAERRHLERRRAEVGGEVRPSR
jgi:RNA polymerase sigma-70 factor (ECF subfamily)